jgi:hypothetical protein
MNSEQQIEAIETALKSIPFENNPSIEVYRSPAPDGSGWLCLKPCLQLDGDFTVDELRQIVAACDAAMGRTTDTPPPVP